jgi:hypothetical protein
LTDQSWREFANCKGKPLNWFFDDYEDSVAIQLKVDDICKNCVVRMQCLEWATENKVEGGVFGRKYFQQADKAKRKKRKREKNGTSATV